jgi:hypothetical protein
MRYRRSIIGLAAATVLGTGLAPAFADPAPPDVEATACPRNGAAGHSTTFKVKGSGANAVVGGWQVKGKRASLCFRGSGGAFGPTTIEATWTTPWQAPPKQEFSADYSISSLNPTAKMPFELSLRFRPSGERWSSWWTVKHDVKPPIGGGAGQAGEVIVYAVAKGQHARLPKIQWQWRITLTLPEPIAVDVTASLTAS